MAKTVIKALSDGPLQVSGEAEVISVKDKKFTIQNGKTIYLCRCGASKNKPFCDGPHQKVRFKDP